MPLCVLSLIIKVLSSKQMGILNIKTYPCINFLMLIRGHIVGAAAEAQSPRSPSP